jgi:hypothetical protein
VTEQRVVAGERVSEGHATKAWPVVRHDGDRSGCFTDHVVVGVDDVHHAAVGTEVVEVEDPFGLDNGPAEATERILAARRRGDGGGDAVLGGVVDDCADPPDPAAGGLAERLCALARPQWVETYADPGFAELAAWCAGLLDRVAAGLPPERVAACERAFRTNLDHELAFWDA